MIYEIIKRQTMAEVTIKLGNIVIASLDWNVLTRDRPVRIGPRISKIFLVLVRSDPRFRNFSWSWSGPRFQKFSLSWSELVRDFQNFLGLGPNWYKISKTRNEPLGPEPIGFGAWIPGTDCIFQ